MNFTHTFLDNPLNTTITFTDGEEVDVVCTKCTLSVGFPSSHTLSFTLTEMPDRLYKAIVAPQRETLVLTVNTPTSGERLICSGCVCEDLAIQNGGSFFELMFSVENHFWNKPSIFKLACEKVRKARKKKHG